MMPRAACALLALCSLTACGPAVDPTFGQSYDACILKNASQGSDDDVREKAESICARHFMRRATPQEGEQAKADADVYFAPLDQAKVAPAPNSTADFYNSFSSAPTNDSISAQITNGNDNLIVKSVHIDAYFHKGPPDRPGGHWSEKDPSRHLNWDLNASIEPGATDTVSGSFDGDHAPSHFYKAFAVADMVVPRTDKPVSRLREVP